MNEKFKNLSELIGKGGKVKENPKSVRKHEEKFFLELIENLCQIEAVNAVLETVGVLVEKINNPHFNSVKMLMEKHYGQEKTTIILWWVFDSITPEGDVYPLVDEDGKEHSIKTPLQLFKFLKRYDEK